MTEPSKAQARIAEIEANRAKRRKDLQAKADDRLVIDLEAIDALESVHGPDRVKVLCVPFQAPDLPVRVAFRAPAPEEMDRYRATVRDRGNPGDRNFKKGDTLKGAEDLAAVTLVYPDSDTFERMCLALTGLRGQAGSCAVQLAIADEEESGKG